jgi:hypothetical protein
MCPQYIKDIKNSKVAPKPFVRSSCYPCCSTSNPSQDQLQQEKQVQKQHGKNPKFKAFLSTMLNFMEDDSRDEEENKGNKDNKKTEVSNEDDNNGATSTFFASLGLSKE